MRIVAKQGGLNDFWKLGERIESQRKWLICCLDASWVDLLFFRGCEYGRGPDMEFSILFFLGAGIDSFLDVIFVFVDFC